MTKEKAPGGTRTFDVLNGMNIPAPTKEDKRAERRLEVGETISEAELVAAKVDIDEALHHGDLRVKA
jgi:hypothetical protein